VTDAPATTPDKKPAPWRGRRRSHDVKGKCMTVRVTVKDRSKIADAAGKAGLTVGAFVRTLALGYAPPRAVKLPLIDRQQLARLLGELGKLGSNVNQIAKAFNSTGRIPTPQELPVMQTDIMAMRAAVMTALGCEP
jgi:Bacterial mobilisation protein (MobC)